MMTEEEARTKWCPMARVDYTTQMSPHPVSVNRGRFAQVPQLCRCIASECMMWVGTDNIAFPEQQSLTDATIVYKSAGYCGLAKS